MEKCQVLRGLEVLPELLDFWGGFGGFGIWGIWGISVLNGGREGGREKKKY